MGIFVNPDTEQFVMDRQSSIYVDKSMMISTLNEYVRTSDRYICVSRPRRFGKTMTANMLSAYYEKTSSADELFEGLKIKNCDNYPQYKNKFEVIKINVQDFESQSGNIDGLIKQINKRVTDELRESYGSEIVRDDSLMFNLQNIYKNTSDQFVFIMDEWDCVFRLFSHDNYAQEKYLDFLREIFKDKSYVALAYMTGILPIKKYGTQSALNIFQEFSMEDPREMAEYTGFTYEETKNLCEKKGADLDELSQWYDGYSFRKCKHIFSPRSIVTAIKSGYCADYWNKTETYESLREYISMNFDGLRDSIIKLMAGERQVVDTGSFQNDMTTFNNKNDVMTLLIHLGYLGYDMEAGEVFIPNREIMMEFITATTSENPWHEVTASVLESKKLIEATLACKEKEVAEYIEKAHLETSHIQYNDDCRREGPAVLQRESWLRQNAAITISLAYYAAREYYTIIRELPSGNGFADIAFIPRKNVIGKPAMIVELKWDKSADTAIRQIKEKKYPSSLLDYKGNILLIGVNYDRKTRKHTCKIEKA